MTWLFELFDRMSSPADKIARSVTRMTATMENGQVASLKLERGFGDMASKAGGVSVALDSVMNIASRVVGAITSITSAVFGAVSAFGQFAVEQLSFKESTLATFEVMLGSKEKATGLFDMAAQFAKVTPFETTDVVSAFSTLTSSGFSQKEVPIVFQALGDVAAAGGMDKSVIPSIALQMAQVKAAGKLQMVDLRVMTGQLAKAGVGLTQVYDAIGKNMGVSSAKVADLMHKGKISADAGIYGIIEAIKNKTGELGGLMEKQSHTIAGLFSTLASVPKDVFVTGSADVQKLFEPGIASFKGLLENLVKLTSGPVFGKLQALVARVFGDLFSVFDEVSGPDGFARLETAANGFLDLLDSGWTVIGDFWSGLKEGFDTISPLIDGFREGFGMAFEWLSSGDIHETMRSLGKVTAEVLGVLGTGLALGVAQFVAIEAVALSFWAALKGIYDTLTGLPAAISNMTSGFLDGFSMPGSDMAQSLIAGFSGPNGIDAHSPSKVFEELGKWSAQGYQKGADGIGMNLLNASDLSASRSTAAPVSSGPVNITIHVSGGGDAAALAEQVAAAVEEKMGEIFDRLAMQTGGA